MGSLLKDSHNTLVGDVIDREDQQDILSEDEKELILEYVKQFIKNDLTKAIYYCYRWDKEFKHLLPEDLIFKVLELINEGRRKCYTRSYNHFRNSVYYHVTNEILTLFKYKKQDDLTDDDPENNFTLSEAGHFYDEGSYADGAEDVLTAFQKEDLREHLIGLFDPNKHIEEIFVLELIFLGYKREDIADELKVAVSEVTNIQKRVVRTLKKHNITQLMKGNI